MPDAAEAAHMAINRHVIGWVGKDEVGRLSIEQPGKIVGISGITAQQPVPPKFPDVALPGYRIAAQDRNFVFRLIASVGRALANIVEQEIDFRERKAGELNIEFEIHQCLKLDCQDLAIPTGIQRQLVVRENIGAAVCIAEMRQPNGRNFAMPEQPGRLETAMPGNYRAVIGYGMGLVKPNRPMLSAIWRICFLECVRALFW
jgi:hypothetical protein